MPAPRTALGRRYWPRGRRGQAVRLPLQAPRPRPSPGSPRAAQSRSASRWGTVSQARGLPRGGRSGRRDPWGADLAPHPRASAGQTHRERGGSSFSPCTPGPFPSPPRPRVGDPGDPLGAGLGTLPPSTPWGPCSSCPRCPPGSHSSAHTAHPVHTHAHAHACIAHIPMAVRLSVLPRAEGKEDSTAQAPLATPLPAGKRCSGVLFPMDDLPPPPGAPFPRNSDHVHFGPESRDRVVRGCPRSLWGPGGDPHPAGV